MRKRSRHLTTALELLKTLPDTPERAQQELTLQLTLGPALMATKGYAAPEVGASLHPGARAVPAGRGNPSALPRAVWAVAVLSDAGGVPDGARAGRAAPAAWPSSMQDPALLWRPIGRWEQTLLCLGEFVPARAHLEQGIALYDPQQHHSHAFLYGHRPRGVLPDAMQPGSCGCLGYPDQALQRSHEALTLAQELSHPL